MTSSQDGIDLICSFESFSATPYPDPASGGEPISTGYGTTHYPDGTKVTMGDAPIDVDTALSCVKDYVTRFIDPALQRFTLTQHQYDAICSFCYNEGTGAVDDNTGIGNMLATNPNSPNIRLELNKWVFAAHKKMPGLVARRNKEADYYFS